MGVSGRTTRDFLRNRWFTPSLQTALVIALTKLGNVSGVESVIQVASQVQGETRVRFLVESVRMLGKFHLKGPPLVKLRMSEMVPIGIEKDGRWSLPLRSTTSIGTRPQQNSRSARH